jgi:hypothetical protein
MRSMEQLFELLTVDTPENYRELAASVVPGLPGVVVGGERGFNERADVLFAAADGTDLNDYWDEINRVVALRNRSATP